MNRRDVEVLIVQSDRDRWAHRVREALYESAYAERYDYVAAYKERWEVNRDPHPVGDRPAAC
jgi:hypothetical protein